MSTTRRKIVRTVFVAVVASVASGSVAETLHLDLDDYRDRLRGGVAGQMIGVSFGAPHEFKARGRTIDGPLAPWRPDRVWNALAQDDLYVEARFLAALQEHGVELTGDQAAATLRDATFALWHASAAARENLLQGIEPAGVGHPRHNPHADCIDFQIEADLFGLLCPALPRSARRLCDRFGPMLGYGDGLYGGWFVAGMYARAWREADASGAALRRCVDAGLRMIPDDSGYARLVRDVLAVHDVEPDDWRAAWRMLEERWADGDLCPDGDGRLLNIDAKLNGGYAVIGLLYGDGDFERTLEISTRCGQDADCNPATAAGVLGTILGYGALPARYTDGFDALTGHSFHDSPYDLPAMLAAMESVTREIIDRAGGHLDERGLVVDAERPAPPGEAVSVSDFDRGDLLRWRRDFRGRALRRAAARIPIADIFPEWELVAVGAAMDPGVRAMFARDRVLALHPVDPAQPARLTRALDVPRGSPRLALEVTSSDERDTADFELRVVIDGEVAWSEVVRTGGAWRVVEVDLAPHAGRQVELAIEIHAGGAKAWFFEAAYIAAIDVRS